MLVITKIDGYVRSVDLTPICLPSQACYLAGSALMPDGVNKVNGDNKGDHSGVGVSVGTDGVTPFTFNSDTGEKYSMGGGSGGGGGSTGGVGGSSDDPTYFGHLVLYGNGEIAWGPFSRISGDGPDTISLSSRGNRGRVKDEAGLEAPHPLLDPVNYMGGFGTGIAKWANRPYWRYVGPTSNPESGWLTRGWGWKAPYGNDFAKAKDALQIPGMPTDVTKVKVPWYEPVIGPRSVNNPDNLKWGTGGGWEYYRDWWWPK